MMIGNPNPNLTMLPHFQTLTLILSLFFSSASSLSPSPSPYPSPSPQTLMSEPSGILRHHQPQPTTTTTCYFDRIGCHLAGGHPHVRRSGNEELNFGKKLGIVFAATAILLQVVLGAFLFYKRIQLKRMSHKGSRSALNSGSS